MAAFFPKSVVVCGKASGLELVRQYGDIVPRTQRSA
jgi:hypothetical protein